MNKIGCILIALFNVILSITMTYVIVTLLEMINTQEILTLCCGIFFGITVIMGVILFGQKTDWHKAPSKHLGYSVIED